MGIGASLLLMAAGAVLTWAADVEAAGVVLLVAGAVGLLVSMLFWSSWGGHGVARGRGRRI